MAALGARASVVGWLFEGLVVWNQTPVVCSRVAPTAATTAARPGYEAGCEVWSEAGRKPHEFSQLKAAKGSVVPATDPAQSLPQPIKKSQLQTVRAWLMQLAARQVGGPRPA